MTLLEDRLEEIAEMLEQFHRDNVSVAPGGCLMIAQQIRDAIEGEVVGDPESVVIKFPRGQEA